MKMCSLASGSSGNSYYIANDATHILLDVGISAKKIINNLNDIDVDINKVSAILITHEHIDHIKALGVISRKYNFPIYMSRGTFDGIKNCKSLGNFDYSLINIIEADSDFYINDILIHPFSINHDAKETLAYRLSYQNKKIAIATDIGSYNDYTIQNLSNLDVLLVEANHDIRMLEAGPYTYDLKRRILGDYGHLSNENSGKLISKILHKNLKKIYLAHLSSENNFPEIALESVKYEINNSNIDYNADDFDIEVALKDNISSLIEF